MNTHSNSTTLPQSLIDELNTTRRKHTHSNRGATQSITTRKKSKSIMRIFNRNKTTKKRNSSSLRRSVSSRKKHLVTLLTNLYHYNHLDSFKRHYDLNTSHIFSHGASYQSIALTFIYWYTLLLRSHERSKIYIETSELGVHTPHFHHKFKKFQNNTLSKLVKTVQTIVFRSNFGTV